MNEKIFLTSMFLLSLLSAIALSFFVLQNFPNSGDEWCYLLQAEIFSQGKLSISSPPNREFFDVGWMVNNGKFYTQHPPGWPLLLAVGVFLRAPWLINPLIGAFTLLVLYYLGKRMYNARVATFALLFTFFSPFFLFNSASYWSHSVSLLFLSLSLLFFIKGIEEDSLRSPAIGGLLGSISFLIRPFDQAAILLACGAFCLSSSIRERENLRWGGIFFFAHLVGVLMLMGYNFLQNGHPLVMGYHLAYGASNIEMTLPGLQYIDDYLRDLLIWTVPGMPLIAGGYIVHRLSTVRY
ncbi:MAG: glycosyltransferase family 39 protein, partial [Candidatus Tectomicrobia bacterium]|nr:glycosyltransferase family 39 protein [Candidatus Tectomicrobia bacterium]